MKKLKSLSVILCVSLTLTAFWGGFWGCKAPPSFTDADSLKIAVLDRGYGKQFAYGLASAYKQKYGKNAEVVMTSQENTELRLALTMGKSSNVDVFFSIDFGLNDLLARKGGVVEGYDPVLAALSDVYDSPAVGYEELNANSNLKVRDIMNPFMTDISSYPGGGEEYYIQWAQGMGGMMYNKTLWDETAAKLTGAAAEKFKLPKTTEEMFKLFDTIASETSISGSGSNKKYALKYAGSNDYMGFTAFPAWLMQYEGQEYWKYFLRGQNTDGQYDSGIYNTEGRLQAYEIFARMLNRGNGYANHTNDFGKHIFDMQLEFLDKDAFFHFNGDWMNRETSLNQVSGKAAFIKQPVMSAIVNKLPSFDGFGANNLPAGKPVTNAAKEEKLRQALDYIDQFDGYTLYGTENTQYTRDNLSWLSDGDLAHLSAARNAVSSLSCHIAFVPAYSERISEAKNFLKFMLSKEGQEIMLKESGGNMAPLTVKSTQFDYFKDGSVSDFTKSKLEIFQNGVIAGWFNQYPMWFLGGCYIHNGSSGSTIEAAFGKPSPNDAAYLRNVDYTTYNSNWDNRKALAGV